VSALARAVLLALVVPVFTSSTSNTRGTCGASSASSTSSASVTRGYPEVCSSTRWTGSTSGTRSSTLVARTGDEVVPEVPIALATVGKGLALSYESLSENDDSSKRAVIP